MQNYERSRREAPPAAGGPEASIQQLTLERQQLTIEMRDKLKDWLVRAQDEQDEKSRGASLAPFTDIVADAEGALITLGYKPQEASRMVSVVNDDSVVSSEELIRRALKSMVKV